VYSRVSPSLSSTQVSIQPRFKIDNKVNLITTEFDWVWVRWTKTNGSKEEWFFVPMIRDVQEKVLATSLEDKDLDIELGGWQGKGHVESVKHRSKHRSKYRSKHCLHLKKNSKLSINSVLIKQLNLESVWKGKGIRNRKQTHLHQLPRQTFRAEPPPLLFGKTRDNLKHITSSSFPSPLMMTSKNPRSHSWDEESYQRPWTPLHQIVS